MQAAAPGTLAGVVGTALDSQVVVRAVTSNGSPVANIPIVFSVSGADSATLNPATMTTDASGLARTTVTLGMVAGTDTLTAAYLTATPATFVLIAEPGPAARLADVSGNDQTAAAGTLLPDSLVAMVMDQYGNPVPGVTVDWSATGGGTPGTAVSTSDANGLVMTTFTLGATPGSESVMAEVSSSVEAVFTEMAQ